MAASSATGAATPRRTLSPHNTPSLFALGLSGGPDIPHAAIVAKRNREGGSGMGKLIQSELSVLESQPVHEHELLEDVKKHYAVQITFRMQITADVDIQWDTILSGRKLYIQVADAQRPVGSKEGFLAMLEYAEEYLNVSHIIVCFAKNHPERNVLVRGFMFLGFTLQPPGLNKIVPHAAIDNCNHYMVYDVES